MNICMFTNTYLPHVGGVARSVISFAEDLRNMGHQVLVVAPEFPGLEKLDENSDETLRVPAIQNFNGSDFSMSLPVPFLIVHRLDQFQPDIIHSHHPYLLGDTALRAAKTRRLPLIFTHHTRYEQYTHYIAKGSDAMNKFAVHLSTEYANLCTQVVAPSRSIARLLQSRGVHTPIAEIPTGVDTDFFARGDRRGFRSRHHIPEKAFVIGYLGRLAPEKNLVFLAAAVSSCMKTLPESYFLVAGEGPGREDIVRIFRNQEIADRLVMAGNQTGSHLTDAYHAMDLFVFSSKSETQGMVLTEAMASGLPVIAIDAPGAREVVVHMENGFLLENNATQETFSETIEHVARHPELVSGMRSAALRTAKAFDRSVCARKLAALYEAAAAESEKDSEETGYPEGWQKLLLSIQTEWELLSEKTKAALKTINNDKNPLDHAE